MEKNMEAIIMGYMETTIRIRSFFQGPVVGLCGDL